MWLNKSYFQSKGVAVSTPQNLEALKIQIENSFGFIIPSLSFDSALLATETRTFYPDAYGGAGMNGNYGSARAASAGDFQVKGLGATSMLGQHADTDHSSGGLGATQAVAEAIWSSILDTETPAGANRVVALIDTGLTEKLAFGVAQPRFLLVRENPLRPAHFIKNLSKMDETRSASDDSRVRENLAVFDQLMSQWHDPSNTGSRDQMFLHFVDTVAEQYAYLHANLLHHGAMSPSNIELSGRLLDLTTVSTLPGAMKAMGQDPLPFGDIDIADAYLLKPFYDALTSEPNHSMRISYEDVQRRLHKSYETQYRNELLKLIGTPDRLLKEVNEMPSAVRLATLMDDLRNAGYDDRVRTKGYVPDTKGKYDTLTLWRLVGSHPGRDLTSRELKSVRLHDSYAVQVTQAFTNYYRDLITVANAAGSSPDVLAREIRDRSAFRAIDRADLRRSLVSYAKKIAAVLTARMGFLDMQRYIDGAIANNALVEQPKVPQRGAIIQLADRKAQLAYSCETVFAK